MTVGGFVKQDTNDAEENAHVSHCPYYVGKVE